MDVPIIFLSHSARDHSIAKALKDVLATHTAGEIEWWLSSDGQSIRGGKNWRTEVEQALRKCKIVFVLFTALSSTSAWVQYEAGFADALEKDIIPIALPGFDIDGIPGPLQHKQGFNIRDYSGLNNILFHVNHILARSYLLNLGKAHYEEIFAENIDHTAGLSTMLDQHCETIEVIGSFKMSVFDSICNAAREIDPNATILNGNEKSLKVGGSGFVLNQTMEVERRASVQEQSEEPQPSYRLAGEISPLMLLETLSILTTALHYAQSDGIVSLKVKFRRQVGIPTRASELLARMKGTPLKFLYEDKLQYNGLVVATETYVANASWNPEFIMIREARSDGLPPDMRFRMALTWSEPSAGDDVRDLFLQLFERNVITTDSRMFET